MVYYRESLVAVYLKQLARLIMHNEQVPQQNNLSILDLLLKILHFQKGGAP